MLPSMPLLMTPIKELADDSSDTSDDSPPLHHSANNTAEAATNIEEANNQLEPNACVSDSKDGRPTQADKVCDKPHTPEKRISSESSSTQKKKKKTQHKKTLAALTPDSGACLETSAQNFAEAYFQKVRNKLDNDKWAQFLQELVEFEENSEKQPAELYKKMELLLSPNVELVDEFLAFLLPHQALQVNRFIPYLMLVKMKEFFRKLNILLLKRQTRQVYTALESLAASPNVTLADVKSVILPLLKSSPMLTNHFLELLPGERPPDSVMTDFEQVDFKDDSLFETIVVPDCPDPYGNENCICSCHTTQKNRHCVSCGIKYLNGRVYLQYGKVLRPAKVTFKGNQHLDLRKWEEDKCRSRRRLLPKTMLSPSCHDNRLNADSEDDCGVKKSPRTPRIRAARSKVCKKGASGSKEEEVLEGIFPLVEPTNVTIGGDKLGELVVDCEMKLDAADEHEFDEVVLENDCNTEEDEEEELNKCLHFENDSSLEAEDIAKELECSFEDEEMEDIEISQEIQNEIGDTIMEENIQDINVPKSVPKMYLSSPTLGSPIRHKGNTYCVEFEISRDDKNEKVDCSLMSHSGFSVEDEPTNEKIEGEIRIPMECEEISTEKKLFSEVELNNEDCDNINTDCHVMTKNDGDNILNNSTKQSYVNSNPESCSDVQKENERISCEEGEVSKAVTETHSSSKEWTREEDKIILQTFQHENGLEQTFETASLQLPNRSKEEIQERFEVLLKLLKEMISDESSSNS